MNSKPHRQNSDFQLRYFLAGDCKTPDGAWSLMYGQKIDMETKLRHSASQRLTRDAKIAKAKAVRKWLGWIPWVGMKAQADILEAEADVPVWELNLEAAKQELATIVSIMDELEPLRQYKGLDVLAAHEAAQQEEWLLELQCRVENYLLTQGTIPHDHLNTMRCHPEFQSKLVPFIIAATEKIHSNNAGSVLAGLQQPQLLQFTKD